MTTASLNTKMDFRACILVLYFGSLPPWFPLWLESSKANSSFRWVLIGDCFTHETELFNVTVIPMSFSELQTKFKSVLGEDISIKTPFKICDFRPAFGVIFEKIVRDYGFWGYCDIDTIWGRFDAFITDEMWETYDKIFSSGHLSFYRNVPEVNSAYLLDGGRVKAKEVFRTSRFFAFDEKLGINAIFKTNGFKVMEEKLFADMDPKTPHFRLTRHTNYSAQAFFYNKGQILQFYLDNFEVRQKEYVYIHFQKRGLKYNVKQTRETIAITPRGFFSVTSEINEKLIHKFNKPIWHEKIGNVICHDRLVYWRHLLRYRKKIRELWR